MGSRKPKILFVQYSGNHGGSTISGELILKGLEADTWSIESVFGFLGTYSNRYRLYGEVRQISHEWYGAKGFRRSVRKLIHLVTSTYHFYRAIKQNIPDVVYANTIVSVPALLAAKLARVPSICHVRELFEDAQGELVIPLFGGKRLVRAILKIFPSRIVFISDAVRENMVGKAPESKFIVVPNAVPDAYLSPSISRNTARDVLGLPHDAYVIGVPGTLRPVKGQEYFLKAVSELVSNSPHLIVAISGATDVPYFSTLMQVAETHEISDRVKFLGNIEDMRVFYKCCDLICVPSRSEPFGRTVIEAFFSGVPLVASSVGGIREIVVDGETGLLVVYGDHAGLRNAIVRLMDNPYYGRSLAAKAKEHALNHYTESIYQQRIKTLVENVAHH